MKALLALLLLAPTLGFAQDTDVRVIGSTFFAAILPNVVEALSALTLALVSYLSVVFTRKTGLAIEEKHRLAMHSAVMTGVSAALKRAAAGANPRDIIKEGIAYAEQSVPDAIKALRPSMDTLMTIGMSKLELLLLAALNVDPAQKGPAR